MRVSDALTYAVSLTTVVLVDVVWCRITGDPRSPFVESEILAATITIVRAVRDEGARR